MSDQIKILSVDDEIRMTDSLKALLGSKGYHVFTANSGKKAKDILAMHRFDLALLDIMMPDMNGLELMDYISDISPDTIIIFITGHATVDTAIKALKKGAYDYVRKPFEYEELLKTIQNAINQKILKGEKEKISEKLVLSEERYRYLVQNSPDIIYTLDDEGNFTFVSDAADRLLGFDSRQLIGRPFITIVRDKDIETAQQFLKEETPPDTDTSTIELELRVKDKKDNFKQCEVRHLKLQSNPGNAPLHLSSGGKEKRLRIYGVIRDLSKKNVLNQSCDMPEKWKPLAHWLGALPTISITYSWLSKAIPL
jgi:PAS domain S-box-containing protein